LGRLGPFDLLRVAQGLGVLATLGCALLVGIRAARAQGALGYLLCASMGLCLPVAAYAVSGMETPVPTLLCTCCVFCMYRPALCAVLGGLAAAFRPELAPWAVIIAFGAQLVAQGSVAPRAVLRGVAIGALAAVPFLGCAAARLFLWGRPYPLSLLAKPSDVSHGAVYVAAACLVAAGPLLLVSRRPLLLEEITLRPTLVVGMAFVAHVLVVLLVGGDWMPYARLLVPVLPGLWLAAVPLAVGRGGAMRIGAAILIGAIFLFGAGREGRGISVARHDVSRELAARPGLGRVASVDIGWVSATVGDVLDLAGVTDADIASLPGGHTSKRIDGAYLLGRGARTVLIYEVGGASGALSPVRDAELRLSRDALFLRHCTPEAFLPMAHSNPARRHGYRLYRCGPNEP
jgi:hypothetical protein